eukprot:Skav210185  [mRNA]  locus=scaffold2101:277240:280722:- [translate_table: standard]
MVGISAGWKSHILDEGQAERRRKRGRSQGRWQEERRKGGQSPRRNMDEEGRDPGQRRLKGQKAEGGAVAGGSLPVKWPEEKDGREVRDRTEEKSFMGQAAQAPMAKEKLNLTVQDQPEGLGEVYLEKNFPGYANECEVSSRPTGLASTPEAIREESAILVEAPPKKDESHGLSGLSLAECGSKVFQRLLEVTPLRSQCTGRDSTAALFPLPTSRSIWLENVPQMNESVLDWCLCVCLGLNSLWGGELYYDGPVGTGQRHCLNAVVKDVERFCRLPAVVPPLSWDELMQIRTIDYKGDEVRVARSFRWDNIHPALPQQVGVVPLVDVCTLGSKYYVEHFVDYLKPKEEWGPLPKPKVMVADHEWGQVCSGLVQSGVCDYILEEDVYMTDSGPLLNGLFGVSKEEWTSDGAEIYRLIMNLVPLNGICCPLQGDVDTLPSWGSMSPFFLQPTENLLVSSEDVKCFFYTMSLPQSWLPFLAFNKLVPDEALPDHLQGNRVYVASKVLPMGFLNSVSLAQHVHRNLVAWGSSSHGSVNPPERELRKDETFTVGNPSWRVYLDNFDLLEKVEATSMVDVVGTIPPGILSLRGEYEVWKVPRNTKKSVARSAKCELQGATVDGTEGVAYPRESKLAKYLGLGFLLGNQTSGTQKQWQVACGGLVYFTMFRRPLLCGLNRVWSHIESYNHSSTFRMRTPDDCKVELFRSLALLPLARLDFRLDVDSMVTCSDASTTGGGICASVGLTPLGAEVAAGGLRGELPMGDRELRVLSIGLFDGIGALRVALEALGVKVLAHVSVEPNKSAQMVVESHYPGTVCIDRVEDINEQMVQGWALKFDQCQMVLIGAGPPCQGVSGLNADREGALRDLRSNLFLHVPRIELLVRRAFSWCAVHSLMESVASMDIEDRDIMSAHLDTEPIKCDAGSFLWCHRPRLYWLSWDLTSGDGFDIEQMEGHKVLTLAGSQPINDVIKGGWLKVEPSLRFPTFTTSRPRSHPGRKPAGVAQCSHAELDRWVQDAHRFPPYQYRKCHALVNSRNELRLPDIEEREAMMGFAPRYTATCLPKGQRKGEAYNDTRLSLIGNSWAVPVVACLLCQLFARLGWIESLTSQEVLDRFRPLRHPLVQGRLVRLPLNVRRKLVPCKPYDLAFKLSNLVSIKGEDILLSAPAY